MAITWQNRDCPCASNSAPSVSVVVVGPTTSASVNTSSLPLVHSAPVASRIPACVEVVERDRLVTVREHGDPRGGDQRARHVGDHGPGDHVMDGRDAVRGQPRLHDGQRRGAVGRRDDERPAPVAARQRHGGAALQLDDGAGGDREVVAVDRLGGVDRPLHRHPVAQQVVDEAVRPEHAAVLSTRGHVHRDDEAPGAEGRRLRGRRRDEQRHADGQRHEDPAAAILIRRPCSGTRRYLSRAPPASFGYAVAWAECTARAVASSRSRRRRTRAGEHDPDRQRGRSGEERRERGVLRDRQERPRERERDAADRGHGGRDPAVAERPVAGGRQRERGNGEPEGGRRDGLQHRVQIRERRGVAAQQRVALRRGEQVRQRLDRGEARTGDDGPPGDARRRGPAVREVPQETRHGEETSRNPAMVSACDAVQAEAPNIPARASS